MHLNLFSKFFLPLRDIILRNKLLFGKSYIKTMIKNFIHRKETISHQLPWFCLHCSRHSFTEFVTNGVPVKQLTSVKFPSSGLWAGAGHIKAATSGTCLPTKIDPWWKKHRSFSSGIVLAASHTFRKIIPRGKSHCSHNEFDFWRQLYQRSPVNEVGGESG